MSNLILKNVNKKYNEFHAVKNINLNIEESEIFGIIGPNGSGKTTILHSIVGIISPTTGHIVINDVDAGNSNAKTQFGFLPDELSLPVSLTGKEFLEFTRKLYGVKEDKRINILVDILGIKQDLPRLIEEYSHGMKKKLMIVASFLHDPEVIIFDEPFRGLDPETVITLKTLISQKKKEGKTILFASHDLLMAQKYLDRVAVISNGQIVALGAVGELIKKYNASSLEEVFLKASSLLERRKEIEKNLNYL
ncbi:MAG: ABC transporter ATP-binding protein [Nanoarchaeota archaeon]